MNSSRFPISPLLGLMGILLLLAGCYMPAAPDVTPTPSWQEIDEAGMATMAAQAAETNLTMTAIAAAPSPGAEPATETPPPPPPTPVEVAPSPTPVPVEVPTPLPVEGPPPTPSPLPTEGTVVVPAGGEITYVVQPGDRLYRIALRYGVNYRELAAYNHIVNPDRIHPGQVLRIPVQGQPPARNEILYTVQPGDNLFRIALRYNLNYLYLASYNNIANPHQIRVGQVIRVPVTP